MNAQPNLTSHEDPAWQPNFEHLLNDSLVGSDQLIGHVLSATVVDISSDFVHVDLGLKTTGKIPREEFAYTEHTEEVAVGDTTRVFLERMEGPEGEICVSRERARRKEAWNHLQELLESREIIQGYIVCRTKGGFTVDLNGVQAFLPSTHADVKAIRDLTPYQGQVQPFRVIKLDETQVNIVVSRKLVLEEDRAKRKLASLNQLAEGQVVNGVVKNITDYGAFIDLGGLDGLLHVTDISWVRVSHPSEVISIGDQVQVKITNIDLKSQRVSLGMKQLQPDPWDQIAERYAVGQKLTATIDNVVGYGIFATLEPGIEGLIHVSELSWTRRNVSVHKQYKQGDTIEVVILEIDHEQRRISLGHKQCWPNPWEAFLEEHSIGSIVTGNVKNLTDFGLFVGLTDELDGMVYVNDIDWAVSGEEALKLYKKGDEVRAKVLDVNMNSGRISLSIKRAKRSQERPEGFDKIAVDSVVTCVVMTIEDSGLHVQFDQNIPGFIRNKELSIDRTARDPARFAIGERIDAKITSINKKTGSVNLSIRAREVAEEHATVAAYGNVGAGAALGDMFGQTLAGKSVKPKAAENSVSEPKSSSESSSESGSGSGADSDSAPGSESAAAKTTETTEATEATEATPSSTDERPDTAQATESINVDAHGLEPSSTQEEGEQPHSAKTPAVSHGTADTDADTDPSP